MSCNSDWTIRFPDIEGELEIRPYSMELHDTRQKYSYLRSRFPYEVGEVLKKETRRYTGQLGGFSIADVLYQGEEVKRLVFSPDFAQYGPNYTVVELHDLQRTLDDGVVDMKKKAVSMKKIYSEVVSKTDNDIIDSVRFSGVSEDKEVLIGKRLQGLDQAANSVEGTQVVNSDVAIDFNRITPEKAIQTLNEKFGVKTWSTKDGELVVGHPPDTGITHVAADNDDRVWRYNNVKARHNSNPIKRLYVQGPWVDEGGIDLDISGWFNKGGTNDVLAFGVAERTDIEKGQVETFSSNSGSVDSMPEIAASKLEEVLTHKNSTEFDIDPEHSGTEVSQPINVQPGDYIQLLPRDELYNESNPDTGSVYHHVDNPREQCGAIVNNDVYNVTNVTHKITNMGHWQMSLEAGLYVDEPIKSYTIYYHPQQDRVLTQEQVEDGIDDGEFLESNYGTHPYIEDLDLKHISENYDGDKLPFVDF